MKTIKLTSAQRSAVEIYVIDPAHESIAFDLRGNVLHVLVDAESACQELIDAANSADEDKPGRGGTLMTLCRKVRA